MRRFLKTQGYRLCRRGDWRERWRAMMRPSYIPIERPWTWEQGTSDERANMVRGHASGCRPLTGDTLRSLFLLTDEGLTRILAGDVWRPEYQQTLGA